MSETIEKEEERNDKEVPQNKAKVICEEISSACVPRIRTFCFGEYFADNIKLKMCLKCIFITELFLPLFDFISDILNGRRLIKECHEIFGSVTIGLTLAPMAVLLPWLAWQYHVLEDYFSGWRKALLLFVYPLAVIMATPSYVLYICFVAIRRIGDPAYQAHDKWNGRTLEGQLPGFLKFSEITIESETQLILGNSVFCSHTFNLNLTGLYILLVLGPAQSLTNMIIQFLGIVASLLSLVKGVAEFHLFTVPNLVYGHMDVRFISLLKSSLFFLPHIVFPSFSMSAIAAFTGYYALIPFSTIGIINLILTFACSSRSSPRQIISLFTTFVAPSVFMPEYSFERALLKRSTLVNTLILLLSLTAIVFLPVITTESVLLSTPGLCHINFNQTVSLSNQVCDSNNLTLGGNMALSESNINKMHNMAESNSGRYFNPFKFLEILIPSLSRLQDNVHPLPLVHHLHLSPPSHSWHLLPYRRFLAKSLAIILVVEIHIISTLFVFLISCSLLLWDIWLRINGCFLGKSPKGL